MSRKTPFARLAATVGLGVSLFGALLAGVDSLLRAARLPLLALADPQAWRQSHGRWLRRQALVASIAALIGLLSWGWGDSLGSGFVLLAALISIGLPKHAEQSPPG